MSKEKKLLSFILCFVMLFSVIPIGTALADTAKNIEWSYDSPNATLNITGSGKMDDYYVYNQIVVPWKLYLSDIENVVIGEGIESIGESAFENCTALSSVILPDTVKEIKYNAFKNCQNLKSIKLGSKLKSINVSAFCNSGLEEIEFPQSLEKIMSSAFEGTKIKKVTVPANITEIGIGAFENCKELEKVKICDGISSDILKASEIFKNCEKLETVTLPENINKIGYDVFYGTKFFDDEKNWDNGALYLNDILLKVKETVSGEFKIKSGIKVVADYAFRDCVYITDVVITSTVKELSEGMFFKCLSIKSIDIPNGVEVIGNCAFAKCESLEKISLPSSLKEIKSNFATTAAEYCQSAFAQCDKLCRVDVNSVSDWLKVKIGYSFGYEDDVFLSTPLENADLYVNGNKVTNVIVPEDITVIEDGSLAYCKSIKTVTLHNKVTTIGNYAFFASNIENIVIPASVKTIGSLAFNASKTLKSVKFLGNPPQNTGFYGKNSSYNILYYYKNTAFKSYAAGYKYLVPYSKGTISKISIYKNPQKNIYLVGDKVSYNGLKCIAHWSDGMEEEINYSLCSLAKCDTSKPGVKKVKVTYGGKSTTVKIYVDNIKKVKISSSKYPQSKHNYANRLNEVKKLSYPSAEYITVKFSAKTFVEKNIDRIYVYNDNFYKTYTGNELAGKTLKIKGDAVKIKLVSDGNNNYYGYSIDSAVATLRVHSRKKAVVKATTSKNGKIVNRCVYCNNDVTLKTIPKIAKISLNKTAYTYNGKVNTPSVTVKDSKGKKLKKGTDYTVSYAKGRKSAGKYAVKVTFKGYYSGSKVLYFTVRPKGTTLKSVTPASGKFTVKWTKQASQTTGYQIQYSTSSSFKNAKAVTINKNTTLKKTVSGLKGKAKYYVRVRTYKKVGKTTVYSSWSKALSVKTK